MKKILSIILLCSLFILILSLFFGCEDKTEQVEDTEKTLLVTVEELMENAYFDTQLHPDLADNGLFFVGLNNDGTLYSISSENIEKVKEKGSALLDPEKPTIINIHGIQNESYVYDQDIYQGSLYGIYNANSNMLNIDDFGHQYEIGGSGSVNLLKLFLLNGYNVMTFDYYRFADDPYATGICTINKTIEAKCWSNTALRGMTYRKRDGSYSTKELDYCLAEYFAGYWLRACNNYENLKPETTRWACHSMGGSVVMSTSCLLMDLIDNKELSQSVLPSRLTLEDPYFGVGISNPTTDPIMSNTDLEVRWTGEWAGDGNTAGKNLDTIKRLVKNYDMPIEMYYANTGVSTCAGAPILAEINKYVSMSYYITTVLGANPHNGVREVYLGSILTPPQELDNATGEININANSTIEDIKKARGRITIQTSDGNSGISNDDIFSLGASVGAFTKTDFYGSVSLNVASYCVKKGTVLTFTATITHNEVNFAGWYDLDGNILSEELIYSIIADSTPIILEARFCKN